MPVDDLATLLRNHGGLDGLARELGQYWPAFIEDENVANDNAPRESVTRWRRLITRLSRQAGRTT